MLRSVLCYHNRLGCVCHDWSREVYKLRRSGKKQYVAKESVTSKLHPPEHTEGSNFSIKSLGLSPSLFFSGKFRNYSKARQSLRRSTAFYQQSVAGLRYNTEYTTCHLGHFLCGHSSKKSLSTFNLQSIYVIMPTSNHKQVQRMIIT